MKAMSMGSRSEAKRKTASGSQELQSVSRRDVLTGTVATIACAFVPISSLRWARVSSPNDVLTSAERQCLEAMVSRIIPAGADGPGALEAGCALYIELALTDAYQSLRKTYRSGLAAVDSRALASGGRSFAALNATEQDKVLSDFEKNAAVGGYGDSAAFFELVRRHTLEGMFGDPSYGGNANFVGWELIGYPGPRMFVSAEMQKMDAKIPRSRMTAKQLLDGSH
jgi:Gluconate 2-dehydrogenase subunit 3